MQIGQCEANSPCLASLWEGEELAREEEVVGEERKKGAGARGGEEGVDWGCDDLNALCDVHATKAIENAFAEESEISFAAEESESANVQNENLFQFNENEGKEGGIEGKRRRGEGGDELWPERYP